MNIPLDQNEERTIFTDNIVLLKKGGALNIKLALPKLKILLDEDKLSNNDIKLVIEAWNIGIANTDKEDSYMPLLHSSFCTTMESFESALS